MLKKGTALDEWAEEVSKYLMTIQPAVFAAATRREPELRRLVNYYKAHLRGRYVSVERAPLAVTPGSSDAVL
jgi:hypothetical protein